MLSELCRKRIPDPNWVFRSPFYRYMFDLSGSIYGMQRLWFHEPIHEHNIM